MKLSIITINYNNLDGLRKTMESVFSQKCKDFEYIVIDGASTDGSAEYVKEHADKLTYWVSEKDTGIYNAMNKGVRAAKGEYLLMLNSGDYLVDEHMVERLLPKLYGEDLIQGNTISEYENGVIYRNRGYGRSELTFYDAINGNFLHQAMFIKRDLHDRYGLYEEEYKKGADTYFFVHVLALGNATFRYVDIDVANFDLNGISAMTDPKWIQIDKDEDERWFGKNMPKRLMDVYVETPKKIKLYDALHQNKLIWGCTMLLVRIASFIYPSKPYTIKERIK